MSSAPSSSCMVFWKPRIAVLGPFVHILNLGSVTRSFDILNHETVGTGSPTTSRKQKTFSPSVEENLSEGLMNLGSFPLATKGDEFCSQSQSFSPFSSLGLSEPLRPPPPLAGISPRPMV